MKRKKIKSAGVKKLQRKPIFESNAEPPEDETTVQKKADQSAAQTANPAIESSLNSSKGSGHPLPENTRNKMESSMGADFSDVRIHDDSDAARMSKDMNAQAFTHGKDIYFNSGKFDPSSAGGQHLLAHELTHTVQQSGQNPSPVQKIVQRAPNNDLPTLNTVTDAQLNECKSNAGYIKKAGSGSPEFHIKELQTRKYKVPPDGMTALPQSTQPLKMPKPGTRNTKQSSIWKNHVKDSVEKKLIETGKFSPDDANDTGKLWRFQQKKNKAQHHGLVGTIAQITKETLVPSWDFSGGPKMYQIEHMVDWQILAGGADKIENLILLEAKKNGEVGHKVEVAISTALETIAKDYKSCVKDIPSSGLEIKIQHDCFIDKFNGDGDELPQELYYKPSAITDLNDVKNPYREDLVSIKQDSIPKGYFLLTTSDRRAAYIISKTAKDEEVGAFKVTVKTKGDEVETVSLKSSISGNTTELGGAQKLQATSIKFNGEGVDKYVIKDREEKSAIASTFKGLSLSKMSPIEIDEKDIIISGLDVSISGKVNPSISILKNVDISFSYENGEFNVLAVVPLDQIAKNVPKPFKVNYCNIEIGGGSKTPLFIGGGLGFSIEKLGNGSIYAKLSKSVTFNGRFNFDTKYFNPAEINVAYEEGKWSIGGNIGIGEGIVKGVKKASLKAAYKEGVFTVDGDAELSIPGIDKIKLHADFAENGDFTFVADVELKKLPGIKSGSAKVTVTSKGEDGLKLGLAGEAVPDLPNVPGLGDLKLTISYLDGVFELRAKVGYKKGRFDGTIEVGVTNKQVDEKGQPQGEAPEKGDVSVFGYGSLKVDIYKDIKGTVSIRLTPEKDVLIGGKIEANNLKPFGEGFNYDKEILAFPEIEFPLAGIPGMSVSAFIKGGVHFKFVWLPLVLKELSVDFKETNINELEKASIEIIGSVGSSAHAEVYLFIEAGIDARVAVAKLKGSLGGEAGLGVDAEAGGKVDATWDMDKGLKFKEIEAFLDVTPKAIFRLTGQVSVDLDLWITSVNLYYHQWVLAEKQLDLSGITLKVKFPIRFKETGEVELPAYESMKIEKPDFTGDSGNKILDDAINGDAKKEEQKKKEELKIKIHDDLRSADNKDVTPTEYTEKMMKKYEKSPELQAFVKTTIEDESRKLEYEHFEEQKSIIRSANVPLANKYTLLNMFTMFHAYVTPADVEAFKAELAKLEEDKKAEAANAAKAGVPQGPDNKPVNDIPGPPDTGTPPLNNSGGPVRKKEMAGKSDQTDKEHLQRNTDIENAEDDFREKICSAKGNGQPSA